MKNFITYYRVSTKEQGKSGLGLEAQKKSVLNYVKSQKGKVIKEFTEVESGKNNERPELLKALELCKTNNYTLLIAKIDRLSRNLTFISSLMDAGTKFVACDMPNANNFTIHIFSALAQQERELISKRTKDALNSIKERIKKKGFYIAKNGNKIKTLGNKGNLTDNARLKGAKIHTEKSKQNENNKKAYELIKLLKGTGLNFSQSAKKLNESNFKTAKGKSFQAVQVQRILNKYSD